MLPQEEHPLLSGLNLSQREAVLSEHPRLLVLAGAGSGKTKTLIQKIIYLIEGFEKPLNHVTQSPYIFSTVFDSTRGET